MKFMVFITIDTEEDNWKNYRQGGNAVSNIYNIHLVDQIFEKYNALPTYLINWLVANDRKAIQYFSDRLEKQKCGIGTHCHPWNTPPLREELNSRNSMLSNLDYELVFEKIERVHQAIITRLGITPFVFRAGRWGFGPNVARCIHELKYEIDTSITPHIDWSAHHGPDFTKALNRAYRFNAHNILADKDDGELLEVPPTIAFLQRLTKKSAQMRRLILKSKLRKFKILGLLAKLRLMNLIWLTPEWSDEKEMIALSRAVIKRGQTFLNMFFHSTCLLPGATPFVKNTSDLEIFLKRIDRFLSFTAAEGCEFKAFTRADPLFRNHTVPWMLK